MSIFRVIVPANWMKRMWSINLRVAFVANLARSLIGPIPAIYAVARIAFAVKATVVYATSAGEK